MEEGERKPEEEEEEGEERGRGEEEGREGILFRKGHGAVFVYGKDSLAQRQPRASDRLRRGRIFICL